MQISAKVMELESENQKLKEEVNRLQQFYGDDYKPKRCQECKLFHQYYVQSSGYYFKVDNGYCVAGKRFKKKSAENERCQFFESRN